MLDEDGYPTDEELEQIAKWDYLDATGCLNYIKARWRYADDGYWQQEDKTLKISTGGWSGNEELLGAMMKNVMLWIMLWESSRRGGHYTFDLTPIQRLQKNARST